FNESRAHFRGDQALAFEDADGLAAEPHKHGSDDVPGCGRYRGPPGRRSASGTGAQHSRSERVRLSQLATRPAWRSETARYGCDMSKHEDLPRNGWPEKRSGSGGGIESPPSKSSSAEPKSDHERTLAALQTSPNCRRIISSGSTVVWMLSSPAQLAAVKRALKH